MFNKKKILCACCAVCVAVQAQNASVSGRVQSSETKEPLQSVNIVIPNLELGSTTDINGQFTINDIPLDNIELKISILGYRDTTMFIQIDNSLVNLGNIFLDPEVLHFEEINVEVHSDLDPTSSLSSISMSGKEMQENMPSMYECILEFNRRGRIPSELVKRSMRLFAEKVMPALRGVSSPG